MIPVDKAWDNFINHKTNYNVTSKSAPNNISPKCSDIYISTKTKLAYLNQGIDLCDVFWKIPVLNYQERNVGVIKKQMKVNCSSPEEVIILENKIREVENGDVCVDVDILKQLKQTKKISFKDIRKINIGLSKKDLISFRKKKRGAFYNCFVLIIRIVFEEKYKVLKLYL